MGITCSKDGTKQCPHCKSGNTTTTCTRHPCTGLTIRYKKCRACKACYKTEERHLEKKCTSNSTAS